MIATLIKKEMKSQMKIILLFLIIISIYSTVIVMMYDPQLGESLHLMAQSMPELFAAFGMQDPGLTMMDFIINYLYGFILIIIPFIYIIVTCYRLIGKYIDKGSFAYLLTTGHNRIQIIVSQLVSLINGIFILIAYATILIFTTSYLFFDEALVLKDFLILNLGLLSLHLFFGGLCYLSACLFNEIKYSVGLGAGLSLLFILIQMLSQVSDKVEFLKYLTPLTLFDPKHLVMMQNTAIIKAFVLLIIALIFIIVGTLAFQKRDLSL